jgi:hypothetical protein
MHPGFGSRPPRAWKHQPVGAVVYKRPCRRRPGRPGTLAEVRFEHPTAFDATHPLLVKAFTSIRPQVAYISTRTVDSQALDPLARARVEARDTP